MNNKSSAHSQKSDSFIDVFLRRDKSFKPLSKKRLDEIIKLCDFLYQLEFCDNCGKENTILLEEASSIVNHYLNLLKNNDKNANLEDKNKIDKLYYWREITDRLNKLESFPTREKELQMIANFLQNKLSSDELSKLKEILEKYHQEIQTLPAD